MCWLTVKESTQSPIYLGKYTKNSNEVEIENEQNNVKFKMWNEKR